MSECSGPGASSVSDQSALGLEVGLRAEVDVEAAAFVLTHHVPILQSAHVGAFTGHQPLEISERRAIAHAGLMRLRALIDAMTIAWHLRHELVGRRLNVSGLDLDLLAVEHEDSGALLLVGLHLRHLVLADHVATDDGQTAVKLLARVTQQDGGDDATDHRGDDGADDQTTKDADHPRLQALGLGVLSAVLADFLGVQSGVHVGQSSVRRTLDTGSSLHHHPG